jgi:serine/threonine protein kinase
MSMEARDLILNLLNRNPKKRLGAGEADATEIKEHKFFAELEWDKIAKMQIDMPKIQVNVPKFN